MTHQSKKQTGFLTTVKEIAGLLLIVFIIRTVGFGLYQVPTGSMETTMLVGERFFADKLTYWFSKPQRGQIIAFDDPLFPYSDNRMVRLFQEYVGLPIPFVQLPLWLSGPSNWTKRVIGMPGDHVKGLIEDGKPVIYLNGVKLEEPYINKYPLVYVWRLDPSEIAHMLQRGADQDKLGELLVPKSYDPSKPFDDQAFYNINPARIIQTESGEMRMLVPGTPLRPSKELAAVPDDRNYWTSSDIFNVHLGPTEYWVMGDNRLGSKDSRFFGPLDQRLIHGKILWRIWSMDSDESWWIVDLIKHPIDFWKKIRWGRFFQQVN